jgi:hypothetical protein
MNGAYMAAGALALVGAAIHGGVGEATVVRKLDAEAFPRTRWGGPQTTLLYIRATWHMLTIAFAGFGAALSVCAAREQSHACAGVGMLAAGSFAGFAAIALAGALARSPRSLIRHPAPLLLSAVALLAWLGSR